jgi:hypothetical protein
MVAAGFSVLVLTGAGCKSTPAGVVVNEVKTSSPTGSLGLNKPPNEPIKPTSDQLPIQQPKVAPEALNNQVHRLKVLPVPFTSQAPEANWDLPYQEACEEASMVMAAEYFKGNKNLQLATAYANQEILKFVDWQKINRGFYEDTTASQVVSIIKDYYDLTAEVADYNPEVVKQALLNNRLVLIPFAGRLLGNPYFHRPGPLYHMLVVKGYEGDEFITNDPGTKRGESFRYNKSVFDRAAHDWNGGDVEHGASVMIIVRRKE